MHSYTNRHISTHTCRRTWHNAMHLLKPCRQAWPLWWCVEGERSWAWGSLDSLSVRHGPSLVLHHKRNDSPRPEQRGRTHGTDWCELAPLRGLIASTPCLPSGHPSSFRRRCVQLPLALLLRAGKYQTYTGQTAPAASSSYRLVATKLNDAT